MGRLKKIDVRHHGSGNAGTTNTIRVMGFKYGLLVFVVDVLKAVAAYLLCLQLFGEVYAGVFAGLGVLLGHNFPFYLKFAGGKGIASSLGVMMALDWRAALPVFGVGVVILWATRYVSLTSLVMLTLFPAAIYFFGHYPETIGVTIFMAAMAFYLHRGNIKRLANGTERKIFAKKSENKEPLS